MKKKSNFWILPCKNKKYRIEEVFSKNEYIEWHQTNKNVEIGDIVYIYLTSPDFVVKYKCQVVDCNHERKVNDNEFFNEPVQNKYTTYMTLELIKTFHNPKTFKQLQEKGLSGVIRCLRYLDNELVNFIDKEEIND